MILHFTLQHKTLAFRLQNRLCPKGYTLKDSREINELDDVDLLFEYHVTENFLPDFAPIYF